MANVLCSSKYDLPLRSFGWRVILFAARTIVIGGVDGGGVDALRVENVSLFV